MLGFLGGCGWNGKVVELVLVEVYVLYLKVVNNRLILSTHSGVDDVPW